MTAPNIPAVSIPLVNPPLITGGSAFSILVPYCSLTNFDAGVVLTYNITILSSHGVYLPLSNYTWVSWDALNRRIVGTAPLTGTYTFRVTVTDQSGGTNSSSFNFTVNSAPVLVSLPYVPTAYQGIPWRVVIPPSTFRVVSGGQLLMTLREENTLPLVAWWSWYYNTTSSELVMYGAPGLSDIGSHTFRLYAGNSLTPLATFITLTVFSQSTHACVMFGCGGKPCR